MKQTYFIILFFVSTFACINAAAQNVSINILTQNSGIVSLGGTVFLEVTIANTSGTTVVPVYKLRPQISVPANVTILATGHDLPSGWTITFNSGTVIRLSNGTDNIPTSTARTILIALTGNALGSPQTISGALLFSTGTAPGAASGAATPGDNAGDNSSTSTIEVTNATPVTLTGFNAVLVNCHPLLNWKTETEINSDRFEIETSKPGLNNWKKISTVAANGNTTSISNYNFSDAGNNANSEKVLYRLKIIDKDGSYKYSDVLSVFVNCKNLQVLVYPNPVQKGKLYVSLSGAGKNTTATLMSVSGQVILKSGIINGTNFINTSGITNGMYILHITDENALYKQVKIFIEK